MIKGREKGFVQVVRKKREKKKREVGKLGGWGWGWGDQLWEVCDGQYTKKKAAFIDVPFSSSSHKAHPIQYMKIKLPLLLVTVTILITIWQ